MVLVDTFVLVSGPFRTGIPSRTEQSLLETGDNRVGIDRSRPIRIFRRVACRDIPRDDRPPGVFRIQFELEPPLPTDTKVSSDTLVQ
jgi:hypothetical protein